MAAEDIIKSLRDFSQKAEKGMLFLFFKQKKVFVLHWYVGYKWVDFRILSVQELKQK